MPLVLTPLQMEKKKKRKILGRALIISSSNKMKPPINASKKTQTIRAGSLKNLRII